jgi:hypothetical protein
VWPGAVILEVIDVQGKGAQVIYDDEQRCSRNGLRGRRTHHLDLVHLELKDDKLVVEGNGKPDLELPYLAE